MFNREGHETLSLDNSRSIPLYFWVIAFFSGFRLRFIGDFYVGEIIALFIVADNYINQKRRVNPKSTLDKFAYVWIFFQLISNVLNNTSGTKSLIVLGSATLTIVIIKAVLILHRRGIQISQILIFIFFGQTVAGILQPKDYGIVNGWKFQYGYFLSALLILLFLNRNRVFIAQVSLIGFAIISILNSARSLASFFVVAFIFSIPKPKPKSFRQNRSLSVMGITAFAIILISIYSVYVTSAKAGFLGEKEISRANRLTSTIYGPLVGRSEAFYSVQAIKLKPILGYGGNPEVSQNLLLKISTKLNEEGVENVASGGHTPETLPMHSILLGTAIFAGIPGAIFWLYVLYLLTKIVQNFRFFVRKERIPIVLISSSQLWSILFSPYGALLRLSISSAVAFLYLTLSELELQLKQEKGFSIK